MVSLSTQHWLINESTTVIPRCIRNINQYFLFNLNKEKVFKGGAIAFDQFTQSHGIHEILFQLFLKFGERIKDKVMALRQGGRTGANGIQMSADLEDTVMYYIESVVDGEKQRHILNFEQLPTLEYTDYTFYIFICANSANELIDGNIIWGDLVKECIKFHAEFPTKNRGKGGEPKYEPDQMWMKLVDLNMLAGLVDLYITKGNVTNLYESVFNADISSSTNSCAATKIFSLFQALHNRSKKAELRQSIWTAKRWFLDPDVMDLDAPIHDQDAMKIDDELEVQMCGPIPRFQFPRRKYMLRIPPSCFTVNVMRQKLFPEVQFFRGKNTINHMPSLLSSFEDGQRKLSQRAETHRRLSHKEYDILDPRQPTTLASNNNNAGGLAIQDRQDIISSVQMSLLGLTIDEGNTDVMQIRREQSRTRGAVLEGLAESCGVPEMFNINAFQFDIQKMLSCSSFTLKPAETSALNTTLTSSYAPIRQEVLIQTKNIYELHEKMQDPKFSVKVKNPDLICRKLFHIIKNWASKEYMKTCRSEDSELSSYQKAVIREINNTDIYVKDKNFTKTYKKFSLFMNKEIREYKDYEEVIFIHSNHSLASLVFQYSLDAWRLTFDLHLNLMIQSDRGETGKSNVVDKMKECSIDGTVESESTRSDKAEFTSEKNKNSAVIFQDEVEARHITKGGTGSDGAKFNNTKSIMTSQKASTRRLIKQVDGSWKSVLEESECISVIIQCSNMNILSMMDSAMWSRMHVKIVETRRAQNERTVSDMKIAEMTKTHTSKLKFEAFKKTRKCVQAVFMEVEQAINCGILHSVSLHVALVILVLLERKMMEAGMSLLSVRSMMRCMILSRQKCIHENIYTHIFSEDSPIAPGEAFDFEDLMRMDRTLFCTSEHVISAIGEQIDQFSDDNEGPVFDILLKMHKSIKSGSQFRQVWGLEEDNGSTRSKGKNDYNYLRFQFDNGIQSFYKSVSDYSQLLSDSNKNISATSVQKVIESWQKRMIKSKEWIRHDDEYGIGGNSLPFMDENSEEKDCPVIIIYKTNNISIHTKFLNPNKESRPQLGRENIVRFIKEIFSCRYQLPQTFLFDNYEEAPHIRKVIEVPGEQPGMPILNIPSAVYLDVVMSKLSLDPDVSELREGEDPLPEIDAAPSKIVDMDLDAYGVLERNKELFITKAKVHPSFLNYNIFDANNTAGAATRLSADEHGIQNNLPYNSEYGYFLGEPLQDYFRMEGDVQGSTFAMQDIKKFYKEFDEPETQESELDMDFDRERYVIGINQKTGQKIYHWEVLPPPLNKPDNYKMMCIHPRIRDHFYDIKYYINVPDQDEDLYPEQLLRSVQIQKQQRFMRSNQFCTTPARELVALLAGQPFLATSVRDGVIFRDEVNDPHTFDGMVLSDRANKLLIREMISGNEDARLALSKKRKRDLPVLTEPKVVVKQVRKEKLPTVQKQLPNLSELGIELGMMDEYMTPLQQNLRKKELKIHKNQQTVKDIFKPKIQVMEDSNLLQADDSNMAFMDDDASFDSTHDTIDDSQEYFSGNELEMDLDRLPTQLLHSTTMI